MNNSSILVFIKKNLIFVKRNCYDLMKLINCNKIKEYKDIFFIYKIMYIKQLQTFIRFLLHHIIATIFKEYNFILFLL